MIAAVLTKPKTIILQHVTVPPVKPAEVKIKVQGCGICSSSLPLWEGREWFNYPCEPGSPGHEGYGIVEETGEEVKTVTPGDHVSFLSYHAYAEYDIATENNLVKLPPVLYDQPFPGEPLGCTMNVFNRAAISANDTVAIIGSGFLGSLLCQLVKHAGAKLIVISKRDYSLQMARKFGADETILLTSTWEVTSKVAAITNNDLCTRVIEATGKQEAIDIATEIIAEYGKIIIAGYHQDGLRQVNFQKWNWKGIDVINAHERDPQKYLTGMQAAIEAVTKGIITPQPLFTTLLSMDELNTGFELTNNRPEGFMKAIVRWT
jgi:2-desacetyl-2-hydroxyethyl bacteriochlorophyllide A dehydrogenase